MIPKQELKRRIKETSNIRRWYQAMPYFDQNTLYHFSDGKTNKFSYGAGRWRNYISPMLSEHYDDWKNSTMCEVGCSAGLFLLKAWGIYDFKRLIGIEAANGGYEQLLITKDYYDQMPLEVHKLALGKLTNTIADSDAPQINIDTFPIVDVTLMSCIHYHMEINYLKKYLQELASKSLYLMLLTDEGAGGPINATSEFFKEQIIGYDKEWELQETLVTPTGWLSYSPPCKNLTVLFYKSKVLKRLLVKECFEKQMEWHKNKGGKHKGWHLYAQEFYTKIFPRWVSAVWRGHVDEYNYKDSLVYKWQRESKYGSTVWNDRVSSERTLSYINITRTMKEHGQEQPIGLQEHLPTVDPWDGWHRVAVAKYLGLKYIYGVDVIPKE